MTLNLLEKYNVPTPRYTSYPTVPYWDKAAPSTEAWVQKVKSNYALNSEISLYIHLPYCEELCTYCGCNKRITKNHQVESPYIDTLLKEWSMYLELLPEKPIIRELHLGGGTPTFLDEDQLANLLEVANRFLPEQGARQIPVSCEASPATLTAVPRRSIESRYSS